MFLVLCIFALSSCSGAVLKSLRGLFKRVPTKELVRRMPKTVPHSNKRPSLPKMSNAVDDIVQIVSDTSLYSKKGVPPKNGFPSSYKSNDYTPFKLKAVDVKIPDPKMNIPSYNGVTRNRTNGYGPNSYMGMSPQLQLNTPATSFPTGGLQ